MNSKPERCVSLDAMTNNNDGDTRRFSAVTIEDRAQSAILLETIAPIVPSIIDRPSSSNVGWSSCFYRYAEHNRVKLFCLLSLVQLLPYIITVVLYGTGYDIFPVNLREIPTRISGEPHAERRMALDELVMGGDKYLNKDKYKTNNVFIGWYTLTLYYSAPPRQNILNATMVSDMKKFETALMQLPGFLTYFKAPKGFLQLVDQDATDKDISTVFHNVHRWVGEKKFNQQRDLFFDKAADINMSTGVFRAHTIRSIIVPNTKNSHSEASETYMHFRNNVLRDFLMKHHETGIGTVKFSFWYSDLYSFEISVQAKHDIYFAIASLVFIMVILMLHSGSFFLTLCEIISIGSSFLWTNLVYRVVLGYKYFGLMHFLAIFIILGLAADDFFVYFDLWKALRGKSRLSKCHRRASKTMLITSVTTAIAFLVNYFCPIPIFYTFGIFMFLLVLTNYLAVISFYPSVILIYSTLCGIAASKMPCKLRVKRRRILVDFFGGPFFNFISNTYVKYLSVACSAAIVIFFTTKTATLQPAKSTLNIFLHPINYEKAKQYESLFSVRQPVEIALVWGLHMNNKSACDPGNLYCTGKTRFDDNLDMSNWLAQKALLKLCHRLHNDTALQTRLRIRRVDGTPEIRCVVYDMEKDFQMENRKSHRTCSMQYHFPVSQLMISQIADCDPAYYGGSKPFEDPALRWYDRFFEMGVVYWWNRLSRVNSKQSDYYDYKTILMRPNPPFDDRSIRYGHRWRRLARSYGGKLAVFAIRVNTTLGDGHETFKTALPTEQHWEDFMTTERAKLPSALQSGFQTTPYPTRNGFLTTWEWYKLEETMWYNAQNGVVAGFVVAIPILLVSNRNIALTAFAMLNILATVLTVVGMIPVLGWSVGICESINLSLVVGLSIDYVVHLSEAYLTALLHQKSAGREALVQDMLRHVGVSITASAVTTLGATCFLFFGNIVYFMQFGVFTFCTIGFSYFYSLFLFTPLLLVCGPTGDQFSVAPFMRRSVLIMRRGISKLVTIK